MVVLGGGGAATAATAVELVGNAGRCPGGGGLDVTEADLIRVSWSLLASVVRGRGAAAEVPGSNGTGCSCLDRIGETLSEEGFDMALEVDRVEGGEVESSEG